MTFKAFLCGTWKKWAGILCLGFVATTLHATSFSDPVSPNNLSHLNAAVSTINEHTLASSNLLISTENLIVSTTNNLVTASVTLLNDATPSSLNLIVSTSNALPSINMIPAIPTPVVEILDPIVLIQTTKGDFFIKLMPKLVPKTCENFLKYVEDQFYTDMIFHRVIDGFIIQGGGFNRDFTLKATYPPIRNESELAIPNKRGTVGMALTTDPHSATSQFYINLVDNPELDAIKTKNKYGFTVFAQVIDGMDVLDKMKKIKTKNMTYYSSTYKREIKITDVPEQEIIIRKMLVVQGRKEN